VLGTPIILCPTGCDRQLPPQYDAKLSQFYQSVEQLVIAQWT